MSNLDAYLDQTLVLECCVVFCGTKNEYKKYELCLKENGLHAQNMISILDSKVKVMEGHV